MWPKQLEKRVEAESGVLERINLVISPRSGEVREGGLPEEMSELSSGNKGAGGVARQKARLLQRPGSSAQSAVQEAVSGVVRPEWRVSGDEGSKAGWKEEDG